jgi:hypothetical protein
MTKTEKETLAQAITVLSGCYGSMDFTFLLNARALSKESE